MVDEEEEREVGYYFLYSYLFLEQREEIHVGYDRYSSFFVMV